MDTFLAVVIIIAVIAGVFIIRRLIRKGVNTAAEVLNKKVIYKNEYKEERQMISTGFRFVTTAAVTDIMKALTAYIAPEQAINAVRGTLYQLSAGSDNVVYAYGNKLNPKMFVASVSFINRGTETQGFFRFLSWHEQDGMLSNKDAM